MSVCAVLLSVCCHVSSQFCKVDKSDRDLVVCKFGRLSICLNSIFYLVLRTLEFPPNPRKFPHICIEHRKQKHATIAVSTQQLSMSSSIACQCVMYLVARFAVLGRTLVMQWATCHHHLGWIPLAFAPAITSCIFVTSSGAWGSAERLCFAVQASGKDL